jgi:hypothetical protein
MSLELCSVGLEHACATSAMTAIKSSDIFSVVWTVGIVLGG